MTLVKIASRLCPLPDRECLEISDNATEKLGHAVDIMTGTQPSSLQRTGPSSCVSIHQATTPADLAAIADCFRAYTEWLGEDLAFQNYAAELDGLPGKYGPPTGALLLARDTATDEVLGCIALRPLQLAPEYRARRQGNVRSCEIKRLFVYPAARGRRVARLLVGEAVKAARREGYQEVLLDTLSRMKPAISLYKSEGFDEVEPYYYNPLDGVLYLAKRIEPGSISQGQIMDGAEELGATALHVSKKTS